jgi:hypothetical protein
MDDLATHAGKTVAVTSDGTIYASTDSGVNWHRVHRAGNAFYGVTYGGGQFLAVGDFGLVATSADGESWVENHPVVFSMSHVLHTGSLYVAVGGENPGNGVIATSPDGLNWTTRFSTNLSGFAFTSVAQNGSVLVAVASGISQRAKSTDGGLTWTMGATPTFYNDITFRGGLFVAVGNGGIVGTSPDGAVFTNTATGEPAALAGVSAGTGATYAVGQGGLILSSTDNVTFTRALALQTVAPLGLRALTAIKELDGQLYVGGGNGTAGGEVIIRSSDGQTFTTPTVLGTLANDIWDFLKQGSTYYAVGRAGTILTSTDSGANWAPIISGSAASTGGTNTTANLNTIAYLNGKFIAGGNGSRILTSPDGASNNWTVITTPFGGQQIYGAAFGNGVYVAVGGSNNPGAPVCYVLTSPDAATWTQRFPPTNQTLRGIVFYQGTFTAVGTDGVIIRSTDGINWRHARSDDFQTNITSVNVRDGHYYATQSSGNLENTHSESQAAVLISSDGESWVRVPLGAVNQPNRAELFQNRLYTANNASVILRTQPLPGTALPVVNVLTPSQHVPQGGAVVLAVTTTGDGSPVYQWNKDGAPIPGATDPGYALFNLLPADAANYTLNVTNAAGTVVTSPIRIDVDANYPAWTTAKFDAGERADPSRSGPNAVFGLDGLPNLVKYGLGLEPKQNRTTGLPVTSANSTDWVCTYTRPSGITDLTYEVEVSTDLITWTTAGVTHEIVSSSGGLEIWHARYPLASAPTRAFFRLKVTRASGGG